MVGEDTPLPPFEERSYGSGGFTFTVDGHPVNFDGLNDDGSPNWMIEELSMSLMLLEQMTEWVLGNYKGAGCCCDYVELGVEDLGNGIAQIRSGYGGEPLETWKTAECSKEELFRAFDAAVATWQGYFEKLTPLLLARFKDKPLKVFDWYDSRSLNPVAWGKAFDGWHSAYRASSALATE